MAIAPMCLPPAGPPPPPTPLPASHAASKKKVHVPEVRLMAPPGARPMPLVGMGTADFPFAPESTKPAILHAIEVGYRHFDTALVYRSEQPLGDAIAEAVRLGMVGSRAELFVTSKLWCTDCHPHRVLPALQSSLRNLQMDYLDLYLIHMPVSAKTEGNIYPIQSKDVVPLDLKSVWEAMEECQKLGLVKAIGVSNFSCKLIEKLLLSAKIPPAVNQVEMNPAWQQRELREFCANKGIHVTAYCPLGGQNGTWSKNMVFNSEGLKEIAMAHGKTVAQVSLRWVHEQGVSMVVKSFNKERIKENLDIFDWELTDEDLHKISLIPQSKKIVHNLMVLGGTPKSLDDHFA